uniref:Indole-3-acetic acid-induced protein ARG7 n=1 Tax=Opuntia streptacantha TaxID=393608 RepID=A0A7C9EGM6_OPUST
MGKSNRIRYIVRLTQMLKRWKLKALSSSSSYSSGRNLVPSDVPPGHVAVCVGPRCRRFILRATHLNHPAIRKILEEAEEEYGFDNSDGPLFIPCDESEFEEALRVLTRSDDLPSRCRVVTESMPLLRSVSEPPIC